MDDSIYRTPYELQLRSENERLKKQLKEMEEVYSEENEKLYQTNQILLAEKKELKEKIQALENRMLASDCLLSTSTCSLNEHDSSLYHTLSKDYAELQENFQSVCDEKFELEAKIEEKNEAIKRLQKVVQNLSLKNCGNEELQGIIEDLQQKNSALEESLKKFNYNIHEMAEVNRDLQNLVCSLQNQIYNLQFCKVFDEPPITLFDELEEIKQDDESELDDEINGENNIDQNALEFNDCESKEEASIKITNELMPLNENVQVSLDSTIDVEFPLLAEDLQEDVLLAEKSIPVLLPENVELKSFQNLTEPYCLKCGSNSISIISLPLECFNDNMETDVSSTLSLPTVRNFQHEGDFIDAITNAQCRRINDQRCDASILKDNSNNRRTETPRKSTSKLLDYLKTPRRKFIIQSLSKFGKEKLHLSTKRNRKNAQEASPRPFSSSTPLFKTVKSAAIIKMSSAVSGENIFDFTTTTPIQNIREENISNNDEQ